MKFLSGLLVLLSLNAHAQKFDLERSGNTICKYTYNINNLRTEDQKICFGALRNTYIEVVEAALIKSKIVSPNARIPADQALAMIIVGRLTNEEIDYIVKNYSKISIRNIGVPRQRKSDQPFDLVGDVYWEDKAGLFGIIHIEGVLDPNEKTLSIGSFSDSRTEMKSEQLRHVSEANRLKHFQAMNGSFSNSYKDTMHLINDIVGEAILGELFAKPQLQQLIQNSQTIKQLEEILKNMEDRLKEQESRPKGDSI